MRSKNFRVENFRDLSKTFEILEIHDFDPSVKTFEVFSNKSCTQKLSRLLKPQGGRKYSKLSWECHSLEIWLESDQNMIRNMVRYMIRYMIRNVKNMIRILLERWLEGWLEYD